MMPAFAEARRAIHRSESELPFVDFAEGVSLQLLQVDLDQGLWVVRTKFQPGITIPTHKHTGPVFAVTLAGSWKYLEYPDVNTKGSYLFQPGGSGRHLNGPKTKKEVTDVWFAIYGANLNLDANGNVEAVIDAQLIHDFYLGVCKSQGFANPPVILGAH